MDDINSLDEDTLNIGLKKIQKLKEELKKVVIGQTNMVEKLLIGILSGGHILVEGVPGLAKTTIIKAISDALGGSFSRVQFTPDLLPSDIVGTEIYSTKEDSFKIKQGPIVAHLVLADEINRAPAKVQSALLEAMQERQVTIGETTISLPDPFLVMATQNPVEQDGTYPLPEAQLDRFMLKVVVDYPSIEEEIRIMEQSISSVEDKVATVIQIEELLAIKADVSKVYIDPKILEYISTLVNATRYPEKYKLSKLRPYIQYGASPRASLNLVKASKASAFLKGRNYVTPEDIQELCPEIFRHRILLSYEAEAENLSVDNLVSQVLEHVSVP